ncbi:MAG: hypothetical protein R3D43_15380 [Tepidamorphaceae bacterium]
MIARHEKTGTPRWKRFVLAVSAILITAAPAASASQYECAVLRQDAGREQPAMDAPLQRRFDETLQVVSPGESYYTTDDPTPEGAGWIELYGTQAQRGNSFIGYFQSGNFNCSPL